MSPFLVAAHALLSPTALPLLPFFFEAHAWYSGHPDWGFVRACVVRVVTFLCILFLPCVLVLSEWLAVFCMTVGSLC